MPNTGPELITAIATNGRITSVDNCPGVPVYIGRAVYGSIQSDTGPGTEIKISGELQKKINVAIGFGGANSETAVWHFSLEPTHHFVVVPWYKHDPPHGQVYTVFMAYENKYTVLQYINGSASAPSTALKGYKPVWTPSQLSTMFSELLISPTAWEEYFGNVGQNQATKIVYWKYKIISLEAAIRNVNGYK